MAPNTGRHFEEVWHRKLGARIPTGYRPGENRRVDKALRLLRPGQRLLDVGCGPGSLATQARTRFREVHGVDLSPTAVALARTNGVEAAVVDLSCEPLPHPDGSFDAVAALGVLPYVWDLDWLLRECVRVLAPEGQMVVGVPNMRALWRLWSLAVRGRFPLTSRDPVGYDGGSMHYFCGRNVVDLLEQHHLTVVGVHGVFCLPPALEGFSDRGVGGWIKRELFSAELVVDARKRSS